MGNLIQLSLEHRYKTFISPLIVARDTRKHTSGSAFFIAPNIAITATHNLEALIRIAEPRYDHRFNLHDGGSYNLKCSFQLLRHVWIGKDGYIVVHHVTRIHVCKISKDISILFTEIPKGTPQIALESATMNFSPPRRGEIIKAYGYADALIGFEGNEHLAHELPDGYVGFGSEFMESAGRVVEVQNTHWAGLRKFPFFSVDSDFLPGMSGGPVFDGKGYVCGMVTSSDLDPQTGEPTAYAASLWPIGGEVIPPDSDMSPPQPLLQLFRQDDVADFQAPIQSVNSNLLTMEYEMTDYNTKRHSVGILYDDKLNVINVDYSGE